MNTKEIFAQGLWKNNAGIVQLLGLCPLLAVTTNAVNGIGLGLATTLTLIISNLLISLIRNVIPHEIRIPSFVLIIAGAVTLIEFIMKAWFYELYLVLGIFIPLIVTNCAILGRAEAFASKNPPLASIYDALAMGFGFTILLAILGGMREIIGSGTLFNQAHLMLGALGRHIETVVIPNYDGFLLAILPPGAFIGLGLIIAVKNIIDARKTSPVIATTAVTE